MSELADKLIKENKTTTSKTLDLANCGLSAIPAEVGDLRWLETLHFLKRRFNPDSGEWVESTNAGLDNQPLTGLITLQRLPDLRTLSLTGGEGISPLKDLSALRSLNLWRTEVSDVTPLSALSALQSLSLRGTQVSDITPLSALSALQSLDLGRTQVSDVTPLSALSALRSLNLWNTKVSDVTPLAALSALKSLDLDETRVSDVTPLSALSALQSLDLSSTRVSDVRPLAALSALESLNLSNTQVRDITPPSALSTLHSLYLSGTQVSDITCLSALSALLLLDLSGTQVSDITPLSALSALLLLFLSYTQVSDVTPLSALSALLLLDLGNTQVSEITPLSALSALGSLFLHYTQVSNVRPLSALSALQSLDLRNTPVSDLSALLNLVRGGLPIKWGPRREPNKIGIFVQNCPLITPPPEIVQQGHDAVLTYFAEREKSGVDRLYEAKMLILGEGGAGKTTLLRRLFQPDQTMPAANESTRGIAIYQHTFPLKNGRTFRLNVWDFAGQEIYRATHQFFLTHRSLYVLLDDTLKDDKSVQDPVFRDWLALVEVFGDGSPVLIFQNEKSGRSKQIDFAGIRSRHSNVQKQFQGDLANPNAADQLRDAIEYFAADLSHIGEALPASWIKVRSDIEELAKSRPHITQQEYFDIYRQHLEFDEKRALILSQYLHDLGVFLHYQKDLLLRGLVILQNEWATEAVFRVLDDEEVKGKLGRFDEQDCARIWHDSVYSAKHAELLALMQNFELCYNLPDKTPKEWLAPQLLPPGKPEELNTWNKQDNLVLRYRYDFLPKGLISRLTVRMHRFVKRPAMAWTTGVLFERDTTRALVELLPDGKHIEIRSHGPEASGLLSAVSFDLDALNESFQGLKSKVATLVPCPCEACAKDPEPWFFDHADLVRRSEHGKSTAECGKSYEQLEVARLLYQFPGWVKSQQGERDQILRIFLASSEELREERDAFELYIRQLNDDLRRQGTYLMVDRWENFLDAMSGTRLQDEYNKAVRQCDIFVGLFFTKVRKYTDEEFESAWGQFKATGKPKIFTYFKNAPSDIDKSRRNDLISLWDFQEKLQKLGHHHSNFDSSEHLKRQFRDQLARLTTPPPDPEPKRKGARGGSL